ncbi:hypothetical protein VCHA53O466_50056 [Vibrio chagasii]|nr:hypothetical protein VCHA53O466_50056 [Vibrio chagasii]
MSNETIQLLGIPNNFTVPEMMLTTKFKKLSQSMYWLGRISKENGRFNDTTARNPQCREILKQVSHLPKGLQENLKERFYIGFRCTLPVPPRLQNEYNTFKLNNSK